MNSTFHSSGTASGNVELMKRWKPTMNPTATAVRVELCENSRISGGISSPTAPGPWEMRLASFEGRRSSGKLR